MPVPSANCPSDTAARSSASMAAYDFYGMSYGQNQAGESGFPAAQKFTLLQPDTIVFAGIRVTKLKDTTRMVTMAEVGASLIVPALHMFDEHMDYRRGRIGFV